MAVIAEGVETKEQLNVISNYNCHEVQGYLFSPPVLPKDFEQFLFNEVKINFLIIKRLINKSINQSVPNLKVAIKFLS